MIGDGDNMILDDPGAYTVSTSSTFLWFTVDIHTIVIGFSSHFAEIHFQSNEDFSSKENVVADEYFLSKSEGVRGVVLTLILVPLVHVPLIY